jgi:hypothetical protein
LYSCVSTPELKPKKHTSAPTTCACKSKCCPGLCVLVCGVTLPRSSARKFWVLILSAAL